MKFEHIEVERKDSVTWIWLNRPDAANAYSDSMVRDLPAVIVEADRDRSTRVVVLAARGKVFCAGGDVKAMREQTGMFAGGPNELRERYMDGIQQIPLAIARLRKPLVALVQGAAVGAGCDLVAMADMRIATSEATFAETFAKVGLVPGDGGAWFLIRAVGHAKATEMFFTGKRYSAQDALNMGLVHEVVSSDQLVRRGEELAQQLAALPPIALQLTKKALAHAFESSLATHLDVVAAFQGITQRSSDHSEALEQMVAKRPGEFRHE
jgi:2-(1,2-epoxy-1,2-dihydrophenyl)acetyl-CoA isomerase